MAVSMKERMFATSGIMARPAGVAGMMASGDPSTAPNAVYCGQELQKSIVSQMHALRVASPYAEAKPGGWYPREAPVQPNQKHRGAGTVSAGSIDNTYLPAPLKNAWGKAREMSKAEVMTEPKPQSTDLLVVCKGYIMPPPKQTVADMATIRQPYSKTIPLLHPMDPYRIESGFMRDPNIIPGAKPAPRFTLMSKGYPATGDDWRQKKLKYDQTAGNMRISVSRIVHDRRDLKRPDSAPPRFMTQPAGLPGGLSLVATD